MTESDPLVGTILAGRYRVVAPIGRGGAGTVYRGVQLQLEREVAIKVVRHDVPDASREELEARFFREAALAGRLSHPHIVKMIDYGATEDGRQFVIMELLRGRSLKAATEDSHLPGTEVARLGAQLARGLHHAHSNGLVHRDVKSSNVFLVRDEEGVEHARLLDFGLVKSTRRELEITQTPTYLGTPLYMSPEQARGEQALDGRSDLYSLGCVLYRIASGRLPFRGDSPMATAIKHINDPYPPMQQRAPDVPVHPRLERIIRRCMEKRPEDRWPDGAALAQALDAFQAQASAPVVDGRASRRRTLWGAVGALGVVGVLVGAVAVFVAVGAVVGAVVVLRSAAEPPPVMVDVRTEPVAAAEVSPVELVAEPGEGVVEPGEVVDPAESGTEGGADAGGAVGGLAGAAPVEDLAADPPPAADPRPARSAPTADPDPVPAVVEPKRPSADTGPEVDGYRFASDAHAQRALEFANTATWSELRKSGVAYKIVPRLSEGRPYASIEALGNTTGIGPATIRAIGDQTRP